MSHLISILEATESVALIQRKIVLLMDVPIFIFQMNDSERMTPLIMVDRMEKKGTIFLTFLMRQI